MILVDALRRHTSSPLGDRLWCHMVSDTSLDDLHAFAARIGLKRAWFQDKLLPHYDLTARMRTTAIRQGALEVSSKELVHRAARKQNEVKA